MKKKQPISHASVRYFSKQTKLNKIFFFNKVETKIEERMRKHEHKFYTGVMS